MNLCTSKLFPKNLALHESLSCADPLLLNNEMIVPILQKKKLRHKAITLKLLFTKICFLLSQTFGPPCSISTASDWQWLSQGLRLEACILLFGLRTFSGHVKELNLGPSACLMCVCIELGSQNPFLAHSKNSLLCTRVLDRRKYFNDGVGKGKQCCCEQAG